MSSCGTSPDTSWNLTRLLYKSRQLLAPHCRSWPAGHGPWRRAGCSSRHRCRDDGHQLSRQHGQGHVPEKLLAAFDLFADISTRSTRIPRGACGLAIPPVELQPLVANQNLIAIGELNHGDFGAIDRRCRYRCQRSPADQVDIAGLLEQRMVSRDDTRIEAEDNLPGPHRIVRTGTWTESARRDSAAGPPACPGPAAVRQGRRRLRHLPRGWVYESVVDRPPARAAPPAM